MELKFIFSKLRIMTITILGFFSMFSIFVLLSPTLLLMWIYSEFIHMLIRYKLGSKYTRPGGLDIMQGIESPQSRPYMSVMGRYKGKVDIHKFRDRFVNDILSHRRDGKLQFKKFTQIFEEVLGYNIFKNADNFDIKDHIFKIELRDLFPEKFTEENGFDKASIHYNGAIRGEESVDSGRLPDIEWEDIVNRLLEKYGMKKFPEGLPQWQVLLLEENEYYTIMMRVHHSYTDGVYYLRFYMEHLIDSAVPYKLPYNYHQPNPIKKFLEIFWAFCLLPMGLRRLKFNYVPNPLHGPELTGEKMFLLSKPIPFDYFKEIKKATKTTINASIFSCLSNALASNFIEKKSTVKTVVLLIPVSMQDLRKPIELKNRFGIKGVLIHTFLDSECPTPGSRSVPSAIDRLKGCQIQCDRAKEDPSFLALHWLMVFVCSLLPSSVIRSVFKSRGLTTSVSNVVGPSDNITMFGCQKTDGCFFIPDRNPMGMGVSIGSYNNKIRVGLMVDRALMKTEAEGHAFLAAFEEELSNIRNEIYLRNNKFVKVNSVYKDVP